MGGAPNKILTLTKYFKDVIISIKYQSDVKALIL